MGKSTTTTPAKPKVVRKIDGAKLLNGIPSTHTNSVMWRDKITFWSDPNSPAMVSLRGQPNEKSPMGVVRIELTDGSWIVDAPYTRGYIINAHKDFQVKIEVATGVKKLHLHSESKGWLTVEIKNGEFVKGPNTQSIHTGRSHTSFREVQVLKTPDDIDAVFVS